MDNLLAKEHFYQGNILFFFLLLNKYFLPEINKNQRASSVDSKSTTEYDTFLNKLFYYFINILRLFIEYYYVIIMFFI